MLALTPGSPLYASGVETLCVSASLEQSRTLFAMVLARLPDDGTYRHQDSSQRLSITHKATGTRLRALSSDGRRAMGLSNFGMILADEPGSWLERGGWLLHQALLTGLGKRPGQKLLYIGTRAPARLDNWWLTLLRTGSCGDTHVHVIDAPNDAPWESWQTIRHANPLMVKLPSLRTRLRAERDQARRDPALRTTFEAYRLNRQVDARQEVLVSLADWKRVDARPVSPRFGRPVVGVDLGATRSWSAAWMLWRTAAVRSRVWLLVSLPLTTSNSATGCHGVFTRAW